MIYVFLASLASLLWIIFFYPLIIFILSKNKKLRDLNDECDPFSIVIVVHNEENQLSEKINQLKNIKSVQLKKIIIVDDGSDDGTWEILKKLDNELFLCLHQKRSGKSCALNLARKHVLTPTVILMDVRQKIEQDNLINLCRRVSSDEFDACSGLLVPEKGSKNYWNFESTLRVKEGLLGMTMGLSGCASALKTSHWVMLPDNCLVDDMALGIGVLARGGRVGLDPAVLVLDPLNNSQQKELDRKVRTLSGNWQMMFQSQRYFFPKSLILKIFLCHHKFLRLFIPFVFILICLSMVISLPKLSFVFFLFIVLVVVFLKKMRVLLSDFIYLNGAALKSFFVWKKIAQKGYW